MTVVSMTSVSGDWLTNARTQRVLTLLTDAGFEAYAVGGCVRNALLGAPVGDVDMSTNAHPEEVMALATGAGLRPVPTGLDHGTVTVVCEGQGFEITTWRADVATDGRRAVVCFADDLNLDAVRRDFTMNALYADAQGRVLDPLGGLPDLRARRLRFIQNAATRIREDYLRSLRYFRFFAWYADPEAGADPEALAAIAANLDGLDSLSRERVGTEMLKLLAADSPEMAVAMMAQVGALMRVLPGADPRALAPLVHHEAAMGLTPDPLRRLVSLGFADGAALRLSKAQSKRLTLLQDTLGNMQSLAEVAHRQGAEVARDVAVLRAAVFEAPLPADAEAQITQGAEAQFPVAARDLMPAHKGAALGAMLEQLRAAWIASGFKLDRAALLARAATGQ